jgi:putative glutamine amidotransferase
VRLAAQWCRTLVKRNRIHRFEQNDKAHGINLIPGSLLNEIANLDRGVVNSAHHQAIKTLAMDLTVNCESDDGIIEGLEWKQKENHPFFLGVQWHPERMFKLGLAQSPFSKNIRTHSSLPLKNT